MRAAAEQAEWDLREEIGAVVRFIENRLPGPDDRGDLDRYVVFSSD